MVKKGDFVTIIDNDFSEYGVEEGDELFIAGDFVTPLTEDDPYALRQIFIAAEVGEDGHVRINDGGFTVDGLRLKAIPPGERLEELRSKLEYDFSKMREEIGLEEEGDKTVVKSVN